jgi:uncharacterized protein (DUF849 family)
MFIKACLNGSRKLGDHPLLPVKPEELARDAVAVVAVGARVLHIHPRNAAGQQSLAAEDQAAALVAIRERCPGLSVGVSTAIWIEPDIALRLRQVQEWTVLPDFASVNFEEPGAAELCHALLARGIGVEAGLSQVAHVELLHQAGLAERCLRILIEPAEEETEAALETTIAIIQALDAAQRCFSGRDPAQSHGNAPETAGPDRDFAGVAGVGCGWADRLVGKIQYLRSLCPASV